jgi:hypothetical protein
MGASGAGCPIAHSAAVPAEESERWRYFSDGLGELVLGSVVGPATDRLVVERLRRPPPAFLS